MYIVTFYSFKGGVGRTMAMANVGLALAQQGRRVLLVDFDLEAPGLDTFDLLKPPAPTLGLVDFVTEYLKTHIAPDVERFVYEPSPIKVDGKVWVMPTGKQNGDYGARLNAIDWQQLYAEESGFLLFEDLKAQWRRAFNPDYVLIDSRTGHTDVGGICTRQLPNAVALLFFPNEQNRRGLEEIVRDINRESRESGRPIHLCAVAANVPNIDDEDGILRQRLAGFEAALERPLDATIHHYDSLSLLQQDIFTIKRPRTKLANEYRLLTKMIISRNLADRPVVAEFLKDLENGWSPRIRPDEIVARLEDISRVYATDGAIVYALAQANRTLGRTAEAKTLFVEAAGLGFTSEEALAERALKEYSKGAVEAARQTLQRALELTNLRIFALTKVFLVAVQEDVQFLPHLFTTLAATGVEPTDRLFIATQLYVRREAMPAIAEFLRPLSLSGIREEESARGEIALCLVGQLRFDEAKRFILEGDRVPSRLNIQDAFNYAMADWGETQKASPILFERVVSLDDEAPLAEPNPNYLQCLAIANWAVGRIEVSRRLVEKARNVPDRKEGTSFSPWRYLRVKMDEFRKDLDALDAMISTGSGRPIVLDAADEEVAETGRSRNIH